MIAPMVLNLEGGYSPEGAYHALTAIMDAMNGIQISELSLKLGHVKEHHRQNSARHGQNTLTSWKFTCGITGSTAILLRSDVDRFHKAVTETKNGILPKQELRRMEAFLQYRFSDNILITVQSSQERDSSKDNRKRFPKNNDFLVACSFL